MPQLTLFDAPIPPPAPLETAPFPPELEAHRILLPSWLRLGAMSWTYPGWRGVLYGADVKESHLLRRGLSAYVQHPLLRTVELDRTYYSPLPAAELRAFADQTPDDFRFIVKAHEACTAVRFPAHARYGARAGLMNPQLLDVGYATNEVVQPFIEGMGAKAGLLLFQFSPFDVRSPERFAEKLHRFLSLLPKTCRYAVELRNDVLLTPAYGRALSDVGAVHCHNAWGPMPGVLEQSARLPEATRETLLVRWLHRPNDTHEGAQKRYLPYDRLVDEDPERREDIATLALSERVLPAKAGEVYLLVSNHAEGCAPQSLALLAKALACRVPQQPAQTLDGETRVL